jgi:hypothetical protein
VKNCIIFIAPFPESQKAQEGFSNRVVSIDNIFSQSTRIYLEFYSTSISWVFYELPKIKRLDSDNDILLFQLNDRSFFIIPLLLILLTLSKIIYIHSIYNANHISYLLKMFKKKIIWDVHGAVPEEIEYLTPENTELVTKFNHIEKTIIQNSKHIIVVSDSMEIHLRNKYKITEDKFVKLPIFIDEQINQEDLKKINWNKKESVIYAGGTTKWHNVDLMIQCAKERYFDFGFLFFSHDIETFKKKLLEANILDNVSLASVSPKDVQEACKTAKFGFLLRDDHVLNKVACPTKLIQYFYFGIIPIIKFSSIGDFGNLKFSYIDLEEFRNNKIPNEEYLEQMRDNNFTILKKMTEETIQSIKFLKEITK